MVALEGGDRTSQRIRDARDISQLFRRQFVEVFVERVPRINPVLNAIEYGKEKGSERDLLVCRGIRCPKFDPFGFRVRRVGRNPDGGGSVPG